MRRTVAPILLLLFAGPALAAPAAKDTSCIACHRDADRIKDKTKLINAYLVAYDVHVAVGLSCHDCHGGNPDLAVAGDPAAAMDPELADHPFVGIPARGVVPAFCGRCHSDPEYMRRYRPDARIDQEQEYRASEHGKLLLAGDPRVAVCTDCHGVHGIRRVTEPDAPVHPTNVAETCRGCHEDAARMAGYQLPDGSPLPVDQYARWRVSVHAEALLVRQDLTAPTCNDCHGNHGATPPGVASVGFVCGQCHPREAELYEQSTKYTRVAEHDTDMLPAMESGCGDCHEAPDPAATITTRRHLGECVMCHGNHSIARPSVALLGLLPRYPCALCHEGKAPLAVEETEPEAKRRHYAQVRDGLLATASSQGLDGDELFDWMLDRTLSLAPHSQPTGDEPGGSRLEPAFERLLTKSRIGHTRIAHRDPTTRELVHEPVTRCTDCHAKSPTAEIPAVGYRLAAELRERFAEITSMTARAERVLHQARRGGVEVKTAAEELDQAVAAEIKLQALVHSFDASPQSDLDKTAAAAKDHARAALAAGNGALGELAYRRSGLAVSLLFVLLVLVALGLKIRQLSGRAS